MAVDGDEITTGELSRNLRDLRTDIAAWRTELTRTLSGFVTLQLYQSEMTTMHAEVARIEAESKVEVGLLRSELAEEREARLRWKLAFFTALAAPIMVSLVVGALVIQKVS